MQLCLPVRRPTPIAPVGCVHTGHASAGHSSGPPIDCPASWPAARGCRRTACGRTCGFGEHAGDVQRGGGVVLGHGQYRPRRSRAWPRAASARWRDASATSWTHGPPSRPAAPPPRDALRRTPAVSTGAVALTYSIHCRTPTQTRAARGHPRRFRYPQIGGLGAGDPPAPARPHPSNRHTRRSAPDLLQSSIVNTDVTVSPNHSAAAAENKRSGALQVVAPLDD